MPKASDNRQLLDELGVKPSKALGQNFLVNDSIIEKIHKKVERYQPPHIIEVGPGLGALTNTFLEKEKITLIELDKSFAQYWRERGLRIINEDALKTDWQTLNLPEGSCLVSNLPYQISASLVIDRSIEPHGIWSMVLMFQKEVAERIQAPRKDSEYGLLSVISQTFWEIDRVCDAGPKDFYPVPNVGSRVLSFSRRPENSIQKQGFLEFVKIAFSQRRKLLGKNLKKRFDEDLLFEEFSNLSLDLKVRPQDLSPEEYVNLYRSLERV
jgi:16S rRNA (adenine1518-N6/adenine1519-N6)-dimethyltransferase